MINDKMLAQMRFFVDGVLPDTCVILTEQSSSDGAGGYTSTWVASGTAFCRIDPLKQASQLDYTASRESLKKKWIMTMASSVTISPSSRYQINGTTYSPVSIYDSHSWSVSSRAEVVEVV
jgi:head-tail adaptor